MIGFSALFCLYIYWLICKFVYVRFIKTSKSIVVKSLLYGALIFFGIGDNLLGYLVYYYNVWKVGGVEIYNTASGVDGFSVEPNEYMDFNFNKLLFAGDYTYIEQRVNNKGYYRKHGKGSWSLKLENGYYELSSGKKGDSSCAQGVFYEKDDKCIRCINIDAPKSRYLIRFNKTIDYSLNLIVVKIVNVEVETAQFIDTANGSVLSDIGRVRYRGGWFWRNIFGTYISAYPEDNPLQYMVIDTVPMVLTNK